MNGSYLALQIRARVLPPIILFRDHFLEEVLPGLGSPTQRASAAANEYFNRIGSQPASDDEDVDMADVADAAMRIEESVYDRLLSARQIMLNLFTAGLYHLVEQQLTDACQESRHYGIAPPDDTQLEVVKLWYLRHFDLDLSSLSSWGLLNELRHAANTIKHGEGESSEQLRKKRREAFRNPCFDDYPDIGDVFEGLADSSNHKSPARQPLAGADVYIRESLFREYGACAETFLSEIAAHFDQHCDHYYPIPYIEPPPSPREAVIHTDDELTAACLREIAKRTVKDCTSNQIATGTQWSKSNKRIRFHFASEADYSRFISESQRLLSGHWALVARP
jgi:hypothetical protein